MHSHGFAAAWESFKYPDQMEEVEEGNIIFMYAKRVGIIGIGKAKSGCKKLKPGDPDRIRNFPDEKQTTEWRIPVDWLIWNEAKAYEQYQMPNCTFKNVTDEHNIRNDITNHFLNDVSLF